MTAPGTDVRSTQVSADGVVVRYGPRLVLDDVCLVAGGGERLALVGENGVGKSTLLRVLAGFQTPDVGRVVRHGSVGLLPQQVPVADGRTVAAALSEATAEVEALQSRRADLEARVSAGADPQALDGYADVLAELDRVDAWTQQSRLAAVLDGLGLADVVARRPLGTLSGGQVSRLALAVLLVRRPSILLLDEPTTHLDGSALTLLEREVGQWPGVVVGVSHDRTFIDAVCTGVVDLDPALATGQTPAAEARPSRTRGAYSDHVASKAAARRRWEAAHAEWEAERERLRALTQEGSSATTIGHGGREPRDNDKVAAHFFSQRVDAAVSRRVRDAQQRLEDHERRRVPEPPALLRFSAPATGTDAQGSLVEAQDVEVPGRLSRCSLRVTGSTRLLVTGANGAGKSTLLAVLAGHLAPGAGRITRAPGVRVGLLAQRTVWADPSLNALSAFAAGREGDVDEHVEALLGVGVLRPGELVTPVGELSVGQQRRVALARLVVTAPDVLLLDEPTDYLSLTLVDELEEALAARPGPLLVASHDRWLRHRWTGDRLVLSAPP